MNILVIRSNISNKKEYSKNNIETVKNVDVGIKVDLIDPIKEQVDKFVSRAEIIICSRYGYSYKFNNRPG